ncbi:MAG: hypothetical protein JHC55_21165, partial [Mycolicibacterium sp.]|nr:hypothetical protein [Mycolicibacterium sp.]MBJ7386994.1 hypothetical protein [Mycolicibacterium sp.]
MGRHSIPDPDESDQQPGADRPGDRADDFAESRYGADEFDSPEPDRPPYGDPDDEGPDYRDDGYWQSQRDAESDDSRFDDAATF